MATATASLPYVFKRSPYSSHALLLNQLPQQGNGRRVLDVGCASGYLSNALAARGYRVVGIDRADLTAHRPSPEVEFIAADLEAEFPELPSDFSHILCGDILEHVRHPLALLRNLRSHLAPGGLLVASLPNSGNLYFRLSVLSGRFPSHDRGLFDRTHLHFYTWSGWVDLFTQGGFQILSLTPTAVPVGLALPRWEGALAIRLLEGLSYLAAHVWKTLFAYQFVVVARPEEAVTAQHPDACLSLPERIEQGWESAGITSRR